MLKFNVKELEIFKNTKTRQYYFVWNSLLSTKRNNQPLSNF